MDGSTEKGRSCFLCLAVGHRVSQCSSNRCYRKCNRKHYQSLCDQSINPKETRANSEGNSSQGTTVAVSRSKVQVLLQTARTYTYTANNELVPIRILMDGGSQCSYVSNQLKTRLKLNPLGQEQLIINTFRNEHFNKRKCDLITVRLQARQGKEIEITAVSFQPSALQYKYPLS